jgi:hypothetical protein
MRRELTYPRQPILFTASVQFLKRRSQLTSFDEIKSYIWLSLYWSFTAILEMEDQGFVSRILTRQS